MSRAEDCAAAEGTGSSVAAGWVNGGATGGAAAGAVMRKANMSNHRRDMSAHRSDRRGGGNEKMAGPVECRRAKIAASKGVTAKRRPAYRMVACLPGRADKLGDL